MSEDFASGEKSRLPTVSIPAVDEDDRMNRVNMAFDAAKGGIKFAGPKQAPHEAEMVAKYGSEKNLNTEYKLPEVVPLQDAIGHSSNMSVS